MSRRHLTQHVTTAQAPASGATHQEWNVTQTVTAIQIVQGAVSVTWTVTQSTTGTLAGQAATPIASNWAVTQAVQPAQFKADTASKTWNLTNIITGTTVTQSTGASAQSWAVTQAVTGSQLRIGATAQSWSVTQTPTGTKFIHGAVSISISLTQTTAAVQNHFGVVSKTWNLTNVIFGAQTATLRDSTNQFWNLQQQVVGRRIIAGAVSVSWSVTQTVTGSQGVLFTAPFLDFQFDPTWYPPDATFTFIAVIRVTSGSTTAYAQLFNVTANAQVAGTQLSTNSTSFTQLETGDIRQYLAAGLATYRVQVGATVPSNGRCGNFFLVPAVQ